MSLPHLFFSAKTYRTICVCLCAHLAGCASQNGKFYEGETLPSDKVAEVSVFIETPSKPFSKNLSVDIGKHRLMNSIKEQNTGYLKPGNYEFSLVSSWWDTETKSKNAVRDVATVPCLMAIYAPLFALPLAVTCGALVPDKTCKSTWTMKLEAGKKYRLDVDWTNDPPRAIAENQTDQREEISTACEIQKKPEPSKMDQTGLPD